MYTGYVLKQTPQDFLVKEISLLSKLKQHPDKNNQITFLLLKKYDFNHFDSLKILTSILKITYDQISVAGIKDEDAITWQAMTINKIIYKKDLRIINKKLCNNKNYLFFEKILGYGNKMLTKASLHGNLFSIGIRNIDKNLCETIQNFIGKGKYFSFVNYYDTQRFGKPGSIYNTASIGQYLIKKEWKKAYSEYLKAEQIEVNKHQKVTNYLKKILEIPQGIRDFYISSYNSLLWNKSASKLLKLSKDSSTANFPILGKLNIICNNGYCQSLHSINEYKIDWANNKIFRETKIRPLIINTKIFVKDIQNDEFHKDKYVIYLDYYLPTGCYATMLIKELFICCDNYGKKK